MSGSSSVTLQTCEIFASSGVNGAALHIYCKTAGAKDETKLLAQTLFLK